MPWPEGWLIQNCLRRKCGILIHTCAFRPCLTFCHCSPQISLDGPKPSEALACLIKWQCEGDERSRRTSLRVIHDRFAMFTSRPLILRLRTYYCVAATLETGQEETSAHPNCRRGYQLSDDGW